MPSTMHRIIFFGLTAAFLLSTCQAGGAEETPGVPGPAAATIPASEALDAYPAPVLETQPVSAKPYPGPAADPSSWTVYTFAEQAVMEGRVAQVFTASDLHVTLALKDGSLMLVLEPEHGYLLGVIERCGELCKDVQVITAE